MKIFILYFLFQNTEARGLVEGLYCGTVSCYEVLGVPNDTSEKDIKKAYKTLAKENHPDRFSKLDLSTEEKREIEEKFQRIATAYETLKGSEREEYDDFLANPDKYYYQYFQYYRRKLVSPKIDLRLIFLVLSLAVSSIQWIGWNTNYKQAIEYMFHVDKYRLAAKKEAEFRGLIGNKKANRGKTQSEIKAEEKRIILEIIEEKVDIRGGYQKPIWTDIFIVQVFYYPVYFYRWIRFHIRWYYKFTLKKEPYGEEEKLILIRKHLNPGSKSAWEEMLDKKKDEFLRRGLWIKSHAIQYQEELAQKEREEKANSARWKQYRRYMKSEAAKQTITFEE